MSAPTLARVLPFQASPMKSLQAKLEAFKRSRAGMFVTKLMDDQAPNLASLLAWGTLSALLPLILGVLSVAGILLQDPQRLDEVYNTVLALVPPQAAGPVGDALQGVRQASAAPAGVVALVLLLYNGSSFFSNMASVFDQAYHVEGRNFLIERLIAAGMLMITTILLVVSTLAVGIGSLVGNVPIGLPIGPTLARVISWSISILSAFVLFLLCYKVLPNAQQGWRNVMPGAILASVLTFLISMLFPLYVRFFPPNHAYAVFGVFLLLTFWLYLLGFIIVLGAELNAFLAQPSRAVALSEATSAALHGKAEYDQEPGRVRAEASGSAPAKAGSGPLGAPARSPEAQIGEHAQPPQRGRLEADRPSPASGPSLVGRLLGFIGLLVAVLLLRGQTAKSSDEHAAA
jgi:membrane protein